jgi:hypothetical protein
MICAVVSAAGMPLPLTSPIATRKRSFGSASET